MSRSIKIAVCNGYFHWISRHPLVATLKSSGIHLNLVEIAGPGEATAEELADALDGTEIAVLNPSDFPPVSKVLPASLKWIQSTFAGMDFLTDIEQASKNRLQKCVITRAGGAFSTPMSEYVVAAVIAMERNFQAIYRSQTRKNWKTSAALQYRLLPSLTIGILGLGDIGRQVAKSCVNLGMTVYGLKRTPTECEGVEKVYGMDNLKEFLKSVDYLCNILPSTPETRGLLSGNVLENCAERRPGFINIGRGDIIDEQSIITALNNGWISKAFLDVFEKEPLPESSPLWSMNNITITPHVSGVCGEGSVTDLFHSNLMKYLEGDMMKYVYSWEKGY